VYNASAASKVATETENATVTRNTLATPTPQKAQLVTFVPDTTGSPAKKTPSVWATETANLL
jgi:hypothetical protein|tara:strand:- start:2691 stop:2876 length:186 start_codon:yes stop_codon:yes gene_type:complete